jgi:integrase
LPVKLGGGPTPRAISEHPAVLVRYMTYLLSKKSLKPATVKRKVKTIRSLLKDGCDLADADNVVRFLNTCSWATGTKDIVIDSYRDYLNMLGLTEIRLPHIRREEKLPFIPLESELDALICNARTKMCAFLRILKETACRPIEAWVLKWIDIDLANRCVTITPAKYSHPRKLKISEQTLNLLSSLPKENQFVFSLSGDKERFADELEHFAINFETQNQSGGQIEESKTIPDFFEDFSALESNYRIRSDEGHLACQRNARTLQHSEHSKIHPFG